mgnify:CR=1 FL=1
MNKEIIFNMNTAFRGEYTITGYRFGHGEKAACIIGAMRGNEFQQLYMCSQLILKLEQLGKGCDCSEQGDSGDSVIES